MRRALRYLGIVVIVVLVLLGVLLGVVRARYGGGVPYPDTTTAPVLDETTLETVVTSPEPIGNVAVSADGRVFYTIHPESRPETNKLLEQVGDTAVPYPDEAFQETGFQTPLGVAIDQQNRLWVIDHGEHAFGEPKLIAFDLETDEVVHEHSFTADEAPLGSFLQDLQVDSTGDTVYIADVSFWRRTPGIVVYDVASQTARRTLVSHESVFPQDYIIRNPIKDMVFFGGLVALKAGVDGIAIDKEDEWVYYAAMNHDSLYRVRTTDLRNTELTADELSAQVERFSDKPLNDGLSVDTDGNVYVTDVEYGSIARVDPDGNLETLIQSDQIRWADALSFGPDGWLYLADSSIPDQMLQPKSHIAANAPYYIYRFPTGAEGIPGQ